MKYDFLCNALFSYLDNFEIIEAKIDSSLLQIRTLIKHRLLSYKDQIEHHLTTMPMSLNLKLNNEKLQLKRLNTLLEAYNAENVLKRGYSLVFQDNRIIKSRSQLKHKEFEIRFADGSIRAIEKEDHGKTD